MGLRRRLDILLACVAAAIAWPGEAHAYLDGGTGSFILQAALATLLGASFFIKSIWRNLAAFFSRIFRKGSGDPDGG